MSSFVEDRAREVDEEEENDRPTGAAAEEEDGDEEEASYNEEGDDDEESGQDSSEEEEGPDEYDYDDKFIARDDEDEEAQAGSEGAAAEVPEAERQKKKKKKRRRELVLEEEDYELLEENTGIRRARPAGHRRIKKARDTGRADAGARALQEELFGAELEELEDEDAEGPPGASRRGTGDTSAAGALTAGRHAAPELADDGGFDEEDEDDWIVDDLEAEAAERGGDPEAIAAAAAARRRRRAALRAGVPDVDPDALEEANEIFGDVSDLLALYEEKKAEKELAAVGLAPGEAGLDGAAESDADDADLDELSDEEVAEAIRQQRAARRRDRTTGAATRGIDPTLLERHFLTPRDEEIRGMDVPERFQLADDPDPPAGAWDLHACAAWVLRRALADPGVVGRLLRSGVREVEGPAPGWVAHSSGPLWDPADLDGGLRDTRSRRGLYLGYPDGSGSADAGVAEGVSTSQEAAAAAALLADDEEAGGLEDGQTSRPGSNLAPGVKTALLAAVTAVLEELYGVGCPRREVATIAMYSKERVSDLLPLRHSDEPRTTRREGASGTYPEGTIQPRHRAIRRWDVLRGIAALARQHRALTTLKAARRAAYEAALVSATDSESAAEIERCLAALTTATDELAVTDVDARFRQLSGAGGDDTPATAMEALTLQPEDGSGSQGRRSTAGQQPRRAGGRLGGYELVRRAGLPAAVPRFALTAAQLGECLAQGFVPETLVPADPDQSPAEFAATYADPSLGFADGESTLRGIVHAAAAELAAEPRVRRALRAAFWTTARVSTFPTRAGEGAIDPLHPLAPAKRLRGRPLHTFMGTDVWLRVAAAERAGLVRVVFDVPSGGDGVGSGSTAAGSAPDGRSSDPLIGPLRALYLTGRVAAAAREWEDVRDRVLDLAAGELSRPRLEQEARARLDTAARDKASQRYSDELWQLAIAPPQPFLQPGPGDEDEHVPEHARRVVAAVWGPGTPPTTFVALDASGSMIDWLHCPQWSGGGAAAAAARRRAMAAGGGGAGAAAADPATDPRRAADAARVKAFLESHDPQLLLVGAGSPAAHGLHADLAAMQDWALMHAPGSRLAAGLQLSWADERLAAAWEASPAAVREFPAAASIVRRAIALGRTALDPLAVLCSLTEGVSGSSGSAGETGSASPLAGVKLAPLQDELRASELEAAVDGVLTTAVAQVGVDVNALASAPWRAATLQYAPGLGPRKAAALRRALQREGGATPHRAALWRAARTTIGDAVFSAAAPALRVRASHVALANADMQRLDDSRVQPERYALALRIARRSAAAGLGVGVGRRRPGASSSKGDAAAAAPPRGDGAEDDGEGVWPSDAEGAGTDDDDAADAAALENAFAEPEEVEALHLWGLALRLQREAEADGNGATTASPHRQRPMTAGIATLLDIQAEFARPYGEMRPRPRALRSEDVFWLALGEREDTLRPGRKVEARIRYVTAAAAFANVPDLGDIDASVPSHSVSSSQGEVDCRDYFKPGDVVTARVLRVDAAEGRLELSTTSSDLNDDTRWEREILATEDPYFVPLTAAERAAAERAARPKRAAFTPRPIRHPLFENIADTEATRRLAARDVPVGTCVFRPSPKGLRHVVLTMRIPDGQVWNLEMTEGTKPPGGGQLQLGSPLTLEPVPGGKKERYDELDEVLSRFVEPTAGHMRDLERFRHWRDGPWEAVSEALLDAKRAAPRGQAVYCLGVEPRAPGMFYLGFVLGERPHREYFMVTHRGFHFRKKDFRSVEKMIVAFKQAPRGEAAAALARMKQPPPEEVVPVEAPAPHYGSHSYTAAAEPPPPPPPPMPSTAPPPPPQYAYGGYAAQAGVGGAVYGGMPYEYGGHNPAGYMGMQQQWNVAEAPPPPPPPQN